MCQNQPHPITLRLYGIDSVPAYGVIVHCDNDWSFFFYPFFKKMNVHRCRVCTIAL